MKDAMEMRRPIPIVCTLCYHLAQARAAASGRHDNNHNQAKFLFPEYLSGAIHGLSLCILPQTLLLSLFDTQGNCGQGGTVESRILKLTVPIQCPLPHELREPLPRMSFGNDLHPLFPQPHPLLA